MCRSRPSARCSNFFRKGNLIALRELALRRTADRVDAQMQRLPARPRDRADLADRRAAAGRASARARSARGWCARRGGWRRRCAPNGSSWRVETPQDAAPARSRARPADRRRCAWPSSWAPRPSRSAGRASARRSWTTPARATSPRSWSASPPRPRWREICSARWSMSWCGAAARSTST